MDILLHVSVALALLGGAFFLAMRLRQKKKLPDSSQDFLEINDIKDGVIETDTQIISLLEVNCINYYLLSDAEQNSIEDQFAALLSSLAFPAQILVQTKRLDVTDAAGEILRTARSSGVSPAIREYGEDLYNYLASWGAARSTFTRRILIAVPASPGEHNELVRRRTLVTDGLHRIGLNFQILSTEKAAEVFYVFYNKDNPARLSDATTYGFFEPVARGVRHTKKQISEAR